MFVPGIYACCISEEGGKWEGVSEGMRECLCGYVCVGERKGGGGGGEVKDC